MRIEIILTLWAVIIFSISIGIGKLFFGKPKKLFIVFATILSLISIPILYKTFKNHSFKYSLVTAQFDFNKSDWEKHPELRYQYIDDLRKILLGLHQEQVDSILFPNGWTRENTWIGKDSQWGEMGVLYIDYTNDIVVKTSIGWE